MSATLAVDRDGPVTTIIRSRIEARNAMDPDSAVALTEALLASRSRRVAIGRGFIRCGRRVLRRASISNTPPPCRARRTRWRTSISRKAMRRSRAARWARHASSFPSP